MALEIEGSSKKVLINGTEYPAWAIDEAWKVLEQHGGSLESTIQAVIMVSEADKKATRVDPNSLGKGYSHNIGGSVVIKTSNPSEDK